MRRFALSAAIGVGAGLAAAVVLAVLELYITGHGYGSITREIISWEPGGVHLSVADLAVLLIILTAAAVTWGLARLG